MAWEVIWRLAILRSRHQAGVLPNSQPPTPEGDGPWPVMVQPYHVASRPGVSLTCTYAAKRPQDATCVRRPTLALRLSVRWFGYRQAAIRQCYPFLSNY
jgi:hypothetical protein